MKKELIANDMLTEESFKTLDKEFRTIAIEATKFAEQSPWPELNMQDVFAP